MDNSFGKQLRPLMLLLIGGVCLGSFPPLSKLALSFGVSPVSYMFYASSGAGLCLLAWAYLFQTRPSMERRIITYYVVTAATAFVLPSLVTVFVVKELGAGLVAIAFTLVPVLTYLFALIFRLEVFDTFRAIGVGFGLCGALLIVFPESISSGSVKLPWMLALAIIPISLATSGIYRTIAWPESSSPLQLTIGMLLTSGIMLGLTMVGYGESFRLSDVDLRGLLVIGIQIIAAFISYLILFEIQRSHGPVFQSLMGYVSTMTGVLVGVFAFGEHFSIWIWLALAFMFFGMRLVGKRQQAP